ncbi:MAG TPA: DNA gyrase C-terminal beta-propeller domain-containing protein [Anaerolineae bacterium]|nr:DNA gyrase C-terminal beta-propeller domain-containing protein [Anaerolineae bacterium]HQK15202.1 DNA gyrase C-terminal beta-propeller domain-containing protein [Anaerolineae bacterium]
MPIERPDLTNVSPEVLAYIESLEAELAAQPARRARPQVIAEPEADAEPELCEPPTTINLITLTAGGLLKRTPRHLYGRQRRGGMGIFDLDAPENDPPASLALADESVNLVLFSDQGRTYRLPVNRLPEMPIRARGTALAGLLPVRPGERLAAALPEGGGEQIALVGERGWVITIRASFVGKSMIPGVVYYDAAKYGPLAAACWLPGSADEVFIATRQGFAIRFPAQRVPKTGCLGIRLEKNDAVVAATATNDAGSVFLLGADGKGTIRLMAGFAANKSPGGGGKIAFKTDKLVAAAAVGAENDIFIISRNSKIIRFQAAEVPPKEGVVQGVNCMALRGDETVAAVVAQI